MTFSAYYYDGKSSARQEVSVQIIGQHLIIHTDELQLDYALSNIKISDRIGNTPRFLYFPDGGKCETNDNDSIDTMLEQSGRATKSQFVHKLEAKWKYVISALLTTALIAFLFFQYGIPTIANRIAFALPLETNILIADNSLKILDKYLFEPSTLSTSRQEELTTVFNSALKGQPDGFHYQLLFRSGEKIGANALALPSGTIVLTDELVALSTDDKELFAVFTHELGHIAHRHSLRSLLQNSAVSALVIALTGDISSISVGLPTFLMETKYSRQFEREADRYAITHMAMHSVDTKHFSTILQRLTESHGIKNEKYLSYIASHPATADRIKMIESTHKQAVQ